MLEDTRPTERWTHRLSQEAVPAERASRPASVLLQAVSQAAGDPGALQGRRVPDGGAGALVVARLALLEDVLQVQLEDGSKELENIRGVIVLVDDGLAELGACRGTEVTVSGLPMSPVQSRRFPPYQHAPTSCSISSSEPRSSRPTIKH